MGHIAHLRKQFKSINTYDYIITLIKRREKKHFMITYCVFIWILTQGCFVPSLVEIGLVVLEKKIFKFCQCIFAISQLSPLGKGRGPSFEQTWTLHPRMLCAKFGWNWPSGSGKDFNFVNVLSLFCNYLPLEKGGAHHLNKLESPSP